MMGNHHDLPTEIWSLILTALIQQSLLALCRTSKQYHQLVTPELYGRVRYWCLDEVNMACNDEAEILRGTKLEYLTAWEASGVGRCDSHTRIFDSTAFIKVLTQSAWLRSLVVSLEMIWDQEGDNVPYKLLDTLASSPLRHLYLWPLNTSFKIPAGTPVTSISLCE